MNEKQIRELIELLKISGINSKNIVREKLESYLDPDEIILYEDDVSKKAIQESLNI